MKVLMIGVDQSTGGGMWTVAKNYLDSKLFCETTGLCYIPTSISDTFTKRILFTAKALLNIFFELKNGKYNIVHVHMAEKGSVYRKNLVMIIAKLFHCKIILHLHGAEFEEWYLRCPKLIKWYNRRILNKADKVLILGHYWEHFIRSLLTCPSKLEVVYNAVSTPSNNLYNTTADNLLFLGVVGKRKGILDLLEALKSADSQLDPKVILCIYGPTEINIEKTIAQMGLEHRAKYFGWLSADKKESVFQNIAVNILPSYNEGLPMTILETMSYGIPNISTSIAAIPEAVTDRNGILIEPGDIAGLKKAIITLSHNRNIRLSKSSAAYETIKSSFSLSAHLYQVMRIYEDLEKM